MKPTKKQLKKGQEIEKKVTEVTINDKGIIINKNTGEPHFKELYDKLSTNVNLILIYDESAPTLKKQIKEQGWTLSKKLFKNAESIRTDLNALLSVGILKDKEAHKCFKRLNKALCRAIEKTITD